MIKACFVRRTLMTSATVLALGGLASAAQQGAESLWWNPAAITRGGAANDIHVTNATIDRTSAAYADTPVQPPILANGRITDASAIVLAVGGRISF